MRVVFSTYGSLGDVYPFLAIAQELCKQGVTCVFITNDSNVDAVQNAGFEAHGVVTDAIVLFERAGLKGEAAIEATRKSISRFWRIVMPAFSGNLDKVEALVGNASAIVGPPWAFNAQSVAEKKGIPFVGAHLWPLGLLSAFDPPVLRDIPGLIQTPASKPAIIWNRLVIHCAKQAMKLMFAKYLNPPRQAYGLGKLSRTPVLDFQLKPARILGLYSAEFAPRPPDIPEAVDLTGFPIIDDPVRTSDPELDAFMEGEPIVFTLGSILSENPGEFYENSVAAVQSLGLKALVLTKEPHLVSKSEGILVRGYVPHSAVFPRARIIVHHGGIGTTAQALIAGKPQMVVPHFGDQPDNAARLERLGVARILASNVYSPASAATVLSGILSSEPMMTRAAFLRSRIKGEAGAARAAQIIYGLIRNG
ncbi:glycosyltransferase [uncultured Tateyamaria sp.]|uniref:glycosyltransferase n=1 Tax=Tateyamaria sp. 1078 TaxID=3417464 RepID=UPI002627732F|nr:glycosyltransferase [uncultured Tateyamaria sp.]